MAISALSEHKLQPVCAQRVVASAQHRIGTAADIVCFDARRSTLVVVELKCGFDGGRKAPAEKGGAACKMKAPLSKLPDCNVNRHMAQLAITWELLRREKLPLPLDRGVLLYVNDEGAEFFELAAWWKKKAPALLDSI
jgi:hypothetical protein